MYDFAECINMYFMYSTIEQKYINNAISLSLDLINNFQAIDGNFFTRITTLNTSHRTLITVGHKLNCYFQLLIY